MFQHKGRLWTNSALKLHAQLEQAVCSRSHGWSEKPIRACTSANRLCTLPAILLQQSAFLHGPSAPELLQTQQPAPLSSTCFHGLLNVHWQRL